MRVHRNPTVKVDANQNPTVADVDQIALTGGADQTAMTADADQNLITSVAETTGRVAAKLSNVIDSLTGAFKSRRKK
jgi:hypothetical protein